MVIPCCCIIVAICMYCSTNRVDPSCSCVVLLTNYDITFTLYLLATINLGMPRPQPRSCHTRVCVCVISNKVR